MSGPGSDRHDTTRSSCREVTDLPGPGRADLAWAPGPAAPVPAIDEVHVWRAALDVDAASEGRLRKTLSEAERSRADRFHFPADRRAAVAAQGILRAVLSRYLRVDPGTIRLRRGPSGKPQLDEGWHPCPLRFNISHSQGLCLYAIALDRQVGIDIEHVRALDTYLQVAERVFDPAHAEALRAMPAAIGQDAFFALWTRYEAWLKARGAGLASIRRTSSPPGYSTYPLTVDPAHAAALAVEGAPRRVRCWTWSA